jgi:hypothetical protein
MRSRLGWQRAASQATHPDHTRRRQTPRPLAQVRSDTTQHLKWHTRQANASSPC